MVVGRGPGGIEIIGHRGAAAHFPENTLPSLAGALAMGARALEWDVRVAACGTPVLFHDAELGRTTNGDGLLAEASLSRLRELDAGAWFSPEFRGTTVPTLEEALHLAFRGGGAGGGARARRAYIEIKAVRPGMEGPDLETLLELLVRAGAFERSLLISLDFGLLRRLRALAPHLALGFVAADEEAMEEGAWEVRRDRNTVLDPDQHLLRADPGRTAGWIEEGIRLVTWTVNEEAHARELLALGVRRLTTDDPGGLRARFIPPGGGGGGGAAGGRGGGAGVP
jgi:glycerophosphoryl diester phosphodiesterase